MQTDDRHQMMAKAHLTGSVYDTTVIVVNVVEILSDFIHAKVETIAMNKATFMIGFYFESICNYSLLLCPHN
jgi:hypothetical protein